MYNQSVNYYNNHGCTAYKELYVCFSVHWKLHILKVVLWGERAKFETVTKKIDYLQNLAIVSHIQLCFLLFLR